jgi:hypothetical protein
VIFDAAQIRIKEITDHRNAKLLLLLSLSLGSTVALHFWDTMIRGCHVILTLLLSSNCLDDTLPTVLPEMIHGSPGAHFSENSILSGRHTWMAIAECNPLKK